jgi:hypothetical protein
VVSIALSLHPRDLLGSILALNVSQGSIRWRVLDYGSGLLRLENVATGLKSESDWSIVREGLASGVFVLD